MMVGMAPTTSPVLVALKALLGINSGASAGEYSCLIPLPGASAESLTVIVASVLFFNLTLVYALGSRLLTSRFWWKGFPATRQDVLRIAVAIMSICYSGLTDAALSIITTITIDGRSFNYKYPYMEYDLVDPSFAAFYFCGILLMVLVVLFPMLSLLKARQHALVTLERRNRSAFFTMYESYRFK